MFFNHRFKPIKDISITPLLEVLSQLNESDWLADEAVKTSLAGARPTQSVFLLNLDESALLEILKQRPVKQSDITKCQGWDRLNATIWPMIEETLKAYPTGGVITRLQLAKLPSGKSINPHFDTGFILRSSHRIHIPLITHEKVEFWIEGQKTFFEAGKAVEINNRLEHSVYNQSTLDRVHLIFDYLPPQHNQYSFLSQKSPFIYKTSLNPNSLPTVLVSTINHAAKKGENHAEIYRVNFQRNLYTQIVAWNKWESSYEPQDLGLRGMSLLGKNLFVLASDRLIQLNLAGKYKQSWTNPYLKEAQTLCIYGTFIYITSPAYDSVLRFNLQTHSFDQAWLIRKNSQNELSIHKYDPRHANTTQRINTLCVNNLWPHPKGLFFSGANYPWLMLLHHKGLKAIAKIPLDTNHAQIFQGGLLYQENTPNKISLHSQKEGKTFAVSLQDLNSHKQNIQASLCAYKGTQVITSPSSGNVAILDLATQNILSSITLPLNPERSIHSIEIVSLN